MRSSWFSRYILPGFILKAAVIGGGYVSGRELEQYFAPHGPLGGLIGMMIAMLIWSVVYAATLEFARVFRAYDYRTFFNHLLGPGAALFEVLYLATTLVVLSVLTSVAGNIFFKVSGWPVIFCEYGFMATVACLLCFGTRLVERFLSLWSFVLYASFGALIIVSFSHFGDRIARNFASAQLLDLKSVISDGVIYAGYNISAITVVLFCARHIETRRDAIIGGLLGGPLAMIPGALFFLAMTSYEPQIRSATVPVEFLLNRLDMPAFRIAFLIIMAVTLLGTCTAMVHSINERVARSAAAAKRPFPAWARTVVAAATMIIAVEVADRIGLVKLVAKGYQYMSWAFILMFLIPILTIGIWKVLHHDDKLIVPAVL